MAIDADCDGVITESDCNDSNPMSTIVANDAVVMDQVFMIVMIMTQLP